MTKTKAIGYVRVSRVGGRGGDAFLSPDLQRQSYRAPGWGIPGASPQPTADRLFARAVRRPGAARRRARVGTTAATSARLRATGTFPVLGVPS